MSDECDPFNLDSHKWEPFTKRPETLLKCVREGCGLVVPAVLFKLPEAHLP